MKRASQVTPSEQDPEENTLDFTSLWPSWLEVFVLCTMCPAAHGSPTLGCMSQPEMAVFIWTLLGFGKNWKCLCKLRDAPLARWEQLTQRSAGAAWHLYHLGWQVGRLTLASLAKLPPSLRPYPSRLRKKVNLLPVIFLHSWNRQVLRQRDQPLLWQKTSSR